MGWRHGARQEPPMTPLPPAVVTGLGCAAAGCGSRDGRQCSYVDRHGRRCPTVWCPEHGLEAEGAPACRRHVGVLTCLSDGLGGAVASPPDLDNRVPSLAVFVGAALEERVLAVLGEARRRNPEFVIGGEALVGPVSGGGVRRWARVWTLLAHTGKVCSVTVEVDEARPEVVSVRVGGEIVAEGVPPWMARLANGTGPADQVTDQAEREAFYDRLAAPVPQAVAREVRMWTLPPMRSVGMGF